MSDETKITPEAMLAGALATARAQGCTCQPDITIRRLVGGVFDATVAHDDWCALMRTRDTN